MKVIRSSKIYFRKWITKSKQNKINVFLKEYSNIVNYFIKTYENDIPTKHKYCFGNKEQVIKCRNETGTWLSYRAITEGFSEGYSMVLANKSLAENEKYTYVSPKHNGKKALIGERINTQYLDTKMKLFDFCVKLTCIGNKEKIIIPLKKHRQFNYLSSLGRKCKPITLTKDYIQIYFEINTESKKTKGVDLGVDTGIERLLATSDGKFYGENYKNLIIKLNKKRKDSKSWHKCIKEIQYYIDETVKKLDFNNTKLIVVENLKNLHYKTKERRRLSKNIRRFVNNWAYRYILTRIKQQTETNRVAFRTVSSWNTSKKCSACGHIDKRNRKNQEVFKCIKCSYTSNADTNASKNILDRFLTGKYGSCYQSRINGDYISGAMDLQYIGNDKSEKKD